MPYRQDCLQVRVFLAVPGLCLSALVAMTVGCAPHAAPAAATRAPLAEVDGQAITADEVDQALGAPLRRIERHLYEMRRQKVEELIGERLLAREAEARGVSVQALLDTEVGAKAGTVTEDEIEAFLKANRARLKGEERTLREQARAHLQGQKLASRRQAFLQPLRARASVVVHLQSPPVFRADVRVDGAPTRGAPEAAVTIVEFSDFHCPYCRQVVPVLEQVLARYSDTVRLVHRDFPIDGLHPQARKAAEAARCAHEQGKFWIYYDVLFANPPRASPEQLKRYAGEAGLEAASFERCLSSGAHAAAVQRDVADGIRLGVTGTPAFFVNGRLLSGAQPLESFVRVIEEELGRAR